MDVFDVTKLVTRIRHVTICSKKDLLLKVAPSSLPLLGETAKCYFLNIPLDVKDIGILEYFLQIVVWYNRYTVHKYRKFRCMYDDTN